MRKLLNIFRNALIAAAWFFIIVIAINYVSCVLYFGLDNLEVMIRCTSLTLEGKVLGWISLITLLDYYVLIPIVKKIVIRSIIIKQHGKDVEVKIKRVPIITLK